MEDFVQRFPLLGRKIFKKLDNQNLAKFKEAGKSLDAYLKNDRLIWARRLQKYNKNHTDFKEEWKSATKKVQVENVKELAITVEKFNAFNPKRLD